METQPQQLTPEQVNKLQRDIVLASAMPMKQPIFQKAIDPTSQLGPVTIEFRNVGLITRFKVVVSGSIRNTDGAVDAVATPFGVQNILSKIKLTDLQNKERIDTSGLHVANLNTVKGRWPYASALQTLNWDNPTTPFMSASAQYGDNFPVVQNLNGLVHGTTKPFRMVYDLPCAYSEDDLRGALFANVVNATGQLDLTINPTPFVGTAQDDTLAVLRSGTCAFVGNLTFTVYQYYLDQLPMGDKGPILPTIDISTAYLLNTITKKGIPAGQDFPVAYANFRDFLSTFAVYNFTGGNDGHGNGTNDVNFWSLESANFTKIFKLFALDAAQDTRDILGTDLPVGMYYFSHRRRPISTLQFGNMQLVLNALTAGVGAYLTIAFESFALSNVLTQAGSLQQ